MAMHRSQQLIYQRRAQQEKLATLQTKLRQQFHEKEFARWENKGSDVQKANELRQRLKQLRDQSQRNLNMRRQQLAMLLESEQAKYQQEIVGSQETPEQVRARMAERVRQLKDERESQRKQYVNEQLYRRFQMNADELRKVDAELRELKTDYQRNVQLMEKQRVMENQYEEEMIFAELGRRELKKRQEKQKEKLREQQEKVQERNAILAIQKQMKDQKVKKEKEMTEAERQMLKQEWERDREMQRLKELELQAKSKDIAKDLIESNERQRKLKQEIIRREKEADKQMIQRILDKEKELAQLEKQQRLKYREEARKTLSSFKNRTQDLAAYEKELDRLIDAERKKREAKQDEQWRKRQQARIQLLHDVYHDRGRKVKEHFQEKQNDLKMKASEKEAVDEAVRRNNQLEQEKRQREAQRNRQEQAKLLEQIRQKQQRRRQLLMELQRQDNEIIAARQDYERKIQERKEKGKAQLEMFKRTSRT